METKLALVAAAVVKFAWLYAAVTALVVWPLYVAVGGNMAAVAMPQAMVAMMRWPQLGTALAGGLLAFVAQGAIRAAGRSKLGRVGCRGHVLD